MYDGRLQGSPVGLGKVSFAPKAWVMWMPWVAVRREATYPRPEREAEGAGLEASEDNRG